MFWMSCGRNFGKKVQTLIWKSHASFSQYLSKDSKEAVKLSHTLFEPPSGVSAPPVIIMPGLLGRKERWSGLAGDIASATGRRIVTVDPRNHGDSPHSDDMTYPLMAADVCALMMALNMERAALIGVGVGGRAMTTMACNYPDAVERLVFVNPCLTTTACSLDLVNYFDAVDDILNSTEESDATHLDAAVKTASAMNASYVDGEVAWTCNKDGILDNYHNLEVCMFAGRYDGPALVIAGEEDVSGLKHVLPNAEVATVKGCTNCIHWDKPEIFVQLVSNFLNQ